MLPNENRFGGYIPSFDFEIFDLPNFSPLQANEFGAFTSFSANTPTGFMDYSVDRLLGVLQTPNESPFPVRSFSSDNELENILRFFQSGTGDLPIPVRPQQTRAEIEAEVERNRQIYQQAKGDYDRVLQQRTGCNLIDLITLRCTPAILSPTGSAMPKQDKPMVSDGKGVLGDDASKKVGNSITSFFQALPEGSGIFLLGIVALVFLFLFVRK
jgi:hypothetical protein